MAITAAMVKELRERTQAGMMDCKKALNAVDGDMDKAIEYLRENGLAKAAKKADRVAAEGLIKDAISADCKKAAIVEVNSETDFVAKNEQFISFVNEVAQIVLNNDVADVEALKALPWSSDASKTVNDVLTEKIATIGENLSIRRFAKLSTEGTIASYTHGGGKIVSLVEVLAEGEKAQEVGRNIAMQVAAANPEFVSVNEVPEEKKAHEKEILMHQALNENPGKPENIIEKMVIGRLNKQLKEICLLEQEYVKDPDFTVGKYVAAEIGKADMVKAFVRFEAGEGIEKKEENFAEEVAKQMQG
ncbi:elongation factor Ts [Sporanaerobium hydrogeniformans]|uniref:Elongation factor Ts n=1 Tax=Sporanaerobium hydrogeniformans TaxID=3072179 RepID=A0AC61DFN3_9FIRM|nr:translation elongation factor Ts [Sporanaerobium hydrogeniformans]PHV71772.1 elongation factor Ts [Sporanaerobium hydrogeniformans]